MLDYLFSDPTQFCQIISVFQYLIFTRPDIYFDVNKVCQFMHALTDTYWAAVKCILCYLKSMISFGLHITHNSSFALHSFTDADWASSVDDRKSTGGYLFFVGNTLISWKSGKQRMVTRSSIKVKYIVLANGTAEILWLQYLLSYMQITPTSMPIIWCDNLDATYLSVNPIFHAFIKHVEVDYYFLYDRVAKKDIQI